MRNFKTIVMNILKITVEEFMSELDASYFFGGSREFGYSTTSSDLDVFIYSPYEEHGFSKISQILYEADAKKIENTDYPGDVWCWHDVIHFVLVPDAILFQKLKADHKIVKRLVDNYPVLKEMCARMRHKGIKGSVVYRILSEMS